MRMFCTWCIVAFLVSLVLIGSERGIAWAEPRDGTQQVAPEGSPTPDVDPFDAKSSIFRMVGGLFLCFGALGAGVHMYKKFVLPKTRTNKTRMQIVERLQISQKSALVLVRLDGRELLMTTGAENSRLVSELSGHNELFETSLSEACEQVGEFNA